MFKSLLDQDVFYHIRVCSSLFWVRMCFTTSGYVQVSPRSRCVLPHQGMFKSLLDQDVFYHIRVCSSLSWVRMCFTTSGYVQVSPRSGCVLAHQGMFKSLLDQDVFYHIRVCSSLSWVRMCFTSTGFWVQHQVLFPAWRFSSVQFKMVSMHSGKPICAPPISQKFPQRCLWNSFNVRLIDNGPLSHPFKEDHLALPL